MMDCDNTDRSEEDGEEVWAVPLDASLDSSTNQSPTHQSRSTDVPLGGQDKFPPQHHGQQGAGGLLSEPKYGHRRTIIQIDIDCFYAQVEMLRNPHLKDKPVGVQQKYLVVTCNYVAREFGVTKMMGLKEALGKCPQLVLVSGEDLTHYRAMSYRITELLQKYTPLVERLGFDENFLDITSIVESRVTAGECGTAVAGFIFEGKDAINADQVTRHISQCDCGCHKRLAIGSQVASEMRAALYNQLGITGCAGIAHNKLLAKLVGATHKPNQQTTLFPEQAQDLMLSLDKVGKIPESQQRVGEKLSELLMPLFHKMVDVRDPFHLTLINVCFAKLEDKPLQNISYFFTRKSKQQGASSSQY